jgi:ubiquinone biosynthesis protein COQ4
MTLSPALATAVAGAQACSQSPVFTAAGRVPPKFRPFKAMGHFRNLVRDKEDTAQVFHIFDCLPRRDFIDEVRTLTESAHGRRLMQSEPFLPTMLDDHATLEALPEGTVGRAYVDFMKREGLSAIGLFEESFKMGRVRHDDQMQWVIDRMRDTHDLLHILTGYGRDALGEQCVLAFTYGQQKSLGNLFIAWAGALEIKRTVKPTASIMSAVKEAQAMGKVARRLVDEDITALMAEPLDAARARLGIGTPTIYQRAHAEWQAKGVDPYNLPGKAFANADTGNAGAANDAGQPELARAA